MTSQHAAHEQLLTSVADRYRADGYEVALHPTSRDVPFDLGDYNPDLIARKPDVALIVEVKANGEKTSFEKIRPLVEETRRHRGWRFVLVTGDDVLTAGVPGGEEPYSGKEIREGIDRANRLYSAQEPEAGFLVLWIAFERLMRKRASQIDLPIERLSPAVLIRQLYTQGEVSIEQFEVALQCQKARNSIVHGFRAPQQQDEFVHLAELMNALTSQWLL